MNNKILSDHTTFFDASTILCIENQIGHSFANKLILEQAFTHSSFANEHNTPSNERLEFLGDAVLNFLVAEKVFAMQNLTEGQMTVLRSNLVQKKSLADCVTKLNLHKHLLIGKSLQNSNTISPSTKENLFEAIVGAVFVDSGIENAKKFVFGVLNFNPNSTQRSFKNSLQELVQKFHGKIEYQTLPKGNSSLFEAKLFVNDILLEIATATSKQQAETLCAKQALSRSNEVEAILKN